MSNPVIDCEKIKKARGKRSITEVADSLGVKYQHLWNIEKGLRVPSLELLQKMCAEYNKPINSFFSDKQKILEKV